ncbi:MAG TPA: GIY-YIG nuclease family protein [Sporichthyaceae bacterium]|nr:GIY-YIG nuclease family protein [Sporichthyaceae bacterium]
MFSPIVAERVGWYVYALRDPRDGRVFYIGKGVGNRVFQHALAETTTDDDSKGLSTKLETIRGIRASGAPVDAYILRHGIATERQAYDIEAALMDLLRLLDPDVDNLLFKVTNAVLGWEHATKGLAHVDVITSLYDAPAAPEITEAVVSCSASRGCGPRRCRPRTSTRPPAAGGASAPGGSTWSTPSR